MTADQRVLFAALPNGPVTEEPGHFRLSVHISPQLANDGADTTLPTFPDWVDWPATVNAIGWSVSFGAAPPVAAAVASAPARSDLWKALFAPISTLVRSHTQPSFVNRKIRSYPARNVVEFLRKQYADVAVNSPDDFPHIDELMAPGAFGNLPMRVLTGSVEGAAVEQSLSTQKVFTNGPALLQEAKDFYQLVRFHRSRTRLENLELDIPVAKPVLDFHQAVSTVGQYPSLLRLLGLVVDLVVDLGGALPASPNEVRVVPTWTPTPPVPPVPLGSPPVPPGSTTTVAVRTRCLVGESTFQARPRQVEPPELVDGRLPLHDTNRFTAIQEDLDGGGLKAVDFAGNLARLRFGRSSASPDRYALPSLRSGGLSVARINRAPEFHERMGRAAAAGDEVDQAVPGHVVLDAEDVTRGHRIDIRDTREGKWFSLSARTGSYKFLAIGTDVPFSDESWVSAAPTEDDSPEQDLYLQETLFRWGGWSLASPRPGARLAITQEDDPPVTSEPNTPGADFPVQIDTRATPGSLPRLRFGRAYEVRARAVDLAGNSVPLDPLTDDRRKTPPVDYARFEPVQTPPMLPHSARTEGESLERVVLRSNHDDADPPKAIVARHIVPPKADQLLAEQHGLFDTSFPNSVVDAATYSAISKYVTPEPPPGPVLQSEQGTFAFSSEGVIDPEDHKKSPHFPVDLVTLPYLPDPIARGATLVFLDHPHMSPGQLFKVPFSAEPAWPEHRPVRLVVRQGESAPSYDSSSHQIDVPLGKADVVHVRLSAYLEPDDLQKLGIWHWIVAAGGIDLQEKVVDGRHWMVTPYRTLTLVHAVRQPLHLAEFRKQGQEVDFQAYKQAAQTFVTFDGSVGFSRKSTSRIDFIATWPEFLDRGPGTGLPTAPMSTPPIPPEQRQAVPFSIPGDRPGGPGHADFDPAKDRQEFGDTKHRQVTYTTVATTRFSEYFVETVDVLVDFGGSNEMVVLLETKGKGVAPGSVKVKNKVLAEDDGKVTGAATYVEGTHFTVDAANGTVTVKTGEPGDGFAQQGQKIVVAYLVPPIVRPVGPGESVNPAVLSIKSSAPPAAPKVVYVVPTFGWESKKGTQIGTYESRRRGKGLRVYLERPWWSTGEGELLGVVLDNPDADNPPSAARAALVTRHGVDPVFRSTDTLPSLTLFSFPAAKKAGLGLSVPGAEGTVVVSGHEVGYDKDRDLWFCDITVNAKSYFPFVKLGLARYQPESVNGAHLSNVVVTDFCQLTPDRFVAVTPVFEPGPPGPPGQRIVRVTGQSYNQAGGDTVEPVVRVTVERLDPDIASELGWTQVGKVVPLDQKPTVGDDSVWSGKITIPSPPPGKKQRLVIEEFERHRTGATPVFGERLVYSDIIDL